MSFREAMEIIKKSIREIFGENVRDVRLEEITLHDSDEKKILTISFLLPEDKPVNPITAIQDSIKAIMGPPYTRVYKTVDFDMKSGKINAIKMYKNV